MTKEEKYDRQLRLWASQGQQSLEAASILVIEPTITSLELLKDLVLPGIGSFTLLDVPNKDHEGWNFFLKSEDQGMDRTQALRTSLNELNEDVQSEHVLVTDVPQWLETVDAEFWTQYDCIVMNYEYPRTIHQLKELGIPLIVASTYGFYGFLRLFKPTYEVVETHPQNLIDLRILDPWCELQEYCDSIDLEKLDLEQHAQIPYLVIQLKAVEEWNKSHDSLPKASAEKAQFKKIILGWKKDYQELNFDEAAENSHKIFYSTKLPYNVQDLFGKVDIYYNATETPTKFWILTKALKTFYNCTGFLPLTGELPDMDSATDRYLHLKGIYKAKAQYDIRLFMEGLEELGDVTITQHEINTFVKHAKHLYFAENSCEPLSDVSLSALEDNEINNALRAIYKVQKFKLKNGKFPAMHELGADEQTRYVLQEIVRSDGKELYNICAVLGGIAGQEAIKLITSQYIPLDNTLVYDGLRSVTERWKLE